jgi:hypothetical protein
MKGNEQVTPLQFMLRVLNDEKAPMEHRMWAAANAAPFIQNGSRSSPRGATATSRLSA